MTDEPHDDRQTSGDASSGAAAAGPSLPGPRPGTDGAQGGSEGPVRGRAAGRHEVRVVDVETVPMTPEQYDRAVRALAVLINGWVSADA